MRGSRKLFVRSADGQACGVVELPRDMNEPVDLLEEDEEVGRVEI